MNPRFTDCEEDALTITPLCRIAVDTETLLNEMVCTRYKLIDYFKPNSGNVIKFQTIDKFRNNNIYGSY